MEEKEKIYKIFDVNINRAREGLRVIEEYIRFYLVNEPYLKIVREIRHKISKLLDMEYFSILSFRDVEKDLGKNFIEGNRKDFYSIIISNFKRVEEAFRVLEEYSKYPNIFKHIQSSDFKKLRYLVYDLEQKICLTFFENKNFDDKKKD